MTVMLMMMVLMMHNLNNPNKHLQDLARMQLPALPEFHLYTPSRPNFDGPCCWHGRCAVWPAVCTALMILIKTGRCESALPRSRHRRCASTHIRSS